MSQPKGDVRNFVVLRLKMRHNSSSYIWVAFAHHTTDSTFQLETFKTCIKVPSCNALFHADISSPFCNTEVVTDNCKARRRACLIEEVDVGVSLELLEGSVLFEGP